MAFGSAFRTRGAHVRARPAVTRASVRLTAFPGRSLSGGQRRHDEVRDRIPDPAASLGNLRGRGGGRQETRGLVAHGLWEPCNVTERVPEGAHVVKALPRIDREGLGEHGLDVVGNLHAFVARVLAGVRGFSAAPIMAPTSPSIGA